MILKAVLMKGWMESKGGARWIMTGWVGRREGWRSERFYLSADTSETKYRIVGKRSKER